MNGKADNQIPGITKIAVEGPEGSIFRIRRIAALNKIRTIGHAIIAYVGGWLSDHVRHRKIVLAAGYTIAIAMAALMILGLANRPALAAVFALAGTFVGVNEALEDSMAAELVSDEQHGMAFGTMAAVNAVGDFGSSLLVGFFWGAYSPAAGFAVAGSLFLAGLIVLLRPRSA